MAGMRMTVHTTGFASTVRKLQKTDPPLHAPAVRFAMTRIGEVGEQQARATAPRGATGGLLAGITHKVDKKALPRWTVIKDTARAPGRPAKRQSKKARAGLAPLRRVQGYRYPGKLNWMKTYPAQGGVRSFLRRHGFGGKPNRHFGWFTRAMVRTKVQMTPILNEAGRLIEREWGR